MDVANLPAEPISDQATPSVPPDPTTLEFKFSKKLDFAETDTLKTQKETNMVLESEDIQNKSHKKDFGGYFATAEKYKQEGQLDGGHVQVDAKEAVHKGGMNIRTLALRRGVEDIKNNSCRRHVDG